MYASKPSGIPSPSVSDTRGSRYCLSPSSSIIPVSPRANPGSVQFAGYGQQYSSVAFSPSLSKSTNASEALSLSIPGIITSLPSVVLQFIHSSNKFSCTSGIPSLSVSVSGGFAPSVSSGWILDTGETAGNCDINSKLAITANVVSNVV